MEIDHLWLSILVGILSFVRLVISEMRRTLMLSVAAELFSQSLRCVGLVWWFKKIG
jgi:hypothetical protein